jgi:hypothetical protein
MATDKAHTTSLASAFSNIFCTNPVIHGLTPAQLSALHLCKHEILAAVYRLYMVIPENNADAILKEYVKVPDIE